MASIQEYLDLIKNAIYGKDVRQAIHDAILQCYLDVSGAHYEDLERNYANLEHNDKQLEQKYEELKLNKVNQPLGNNNQPVYGVAGQTLRTRGDGKTEWADVGVPTDSQTDRAISNWLDRHPEATTTVEDGALTYKKLVNGTLGYVTPEMYGAEGDGSTDDTSSFISALGANLPVHLLSGKIYVISELDILSSIQIYGNGATLKRKPNADYAIKFSGDGGLLENIVVDGNMDSDDISATGIWITGDNVTLKNAEVFNCRNEEDAHAGIYLDSASFCIISKIIVRNNDKSAVLLDDCESCIIEHLVGYDNLGSAITGHANNSIYRNIETYNNGYSAVSVNGINCFVDDIISHDNGYSGLNLGHVGELLKCDSCRVRNVISYKNGFEGITITNSKDVKIDNALMYENMRNNCRLMNNSEVVFEKCKFYDSPTKTGLYVDSGSAMVLDCESYNNLTGINVNTGQLALIRDTAVYNNHGTGILLNATDGVVIENSTVYDDQVAPTQTTGVWLANSCSNTQFMNVNIYGNSEYQKRVTGTNINNIDASQEHIIKAADATSFGLTAGQNITINRQKCFKIGRHIMGIFEVTPSASISGGSVIAKIPISSMSGASISAGEMMCLTSKFNNNVVAFAASLPVDADGNIKQTIGTMSSGTSSIFRFDYYLD